MADGRGVDWLPRARRVNARRPGDLLVVALSSAVIILLGLVAVILRLGGEVAPGAAALQPVPRVAPSSPPRSEQPTALALSSAPPPAATSFETTPPPAPPAPLRADPPKAESARPEAARSEPAKPESAPRAGGPGATWAVYFDSFPDQTSVAAQINVLQGRYGPHLGGRRLTYARAGDDSWRVRVAGLTEAAAGEICEKVRRTGGACVIGGR